MLLTTHSPGLAALLPVSSLRLVKKVAGEVTVESGSDAVLNEICTELGVLTETVDTDARPKVLVMLEGPNDVAFVSRLIEVWRERSMRAPTVDADCVLVPAGGQDLQHWIEHRYLRSMGLREVHVYDRDPPAPTNPTPKYERFVANVNARQDGSVGLLTNKQATENYHHPDAVRDAALQELGLTISVPSWSDSDDVVATCTGLLEGTRLPKNCKAWLNTVATKYLTFAQLQDRGAVDEIQRWFDAILGTTSAPAP